ncbi:Glutamyl-tRNA(Gln) amidotransferase subunit B, mitochondrial {ECO:0000255/HAMAP-Rule:MF_03147} Short=Glu-AdT subunit B {ECO:0000255/HAMAP-Rule:MF_03147}; {ECO:0000255/HAMAP-Rule:MF_03147}; Flags: Precursor [Serendipita indica DSM 11827]|nr:Glutamyl-tRNA(Gln) amidotransferase subunit B, mitochondrial {ECO:0000255/HAMAP-Rule:MF_03147} Short=Glu-AdT subunit B {ECO:0000255/HAMAP-Rule:MF_03147}; {ECO:0000255/HAMAP-Rule:MF_03147}; Flags: Precursor [Serendipita indica DSM 11827]
MSVVNLTCTPSHNEQVDEFDPLNDAATPRRKSAHKKSKEKPQSVRDQWPGWNIIVGIEVHAQLKTRNKLFSHTIVAENPDIMPNERVSLFDAAFPGTLPRINPMCISLAARTALALQADIQPRSAFDRKHYFYGDLPAGYQITQNYAPFARNGHVELLKTGKQVRIKQIQIEQDTAKSLSSGSGTTYDLNRVGMPLLEIVSQPDITSAEEAGEYVRSLQAILRSVGVSDGMMEAGSFRCDVNVSIHRDGEPMGTRTEVKNLNSIKSVILATNAEVVRQMAILNAVPSSSSNSPRIAQETLTFDEDTMLTRPLRSKEGVEDYRYMPDPNLPNVLFRKDDVSSIQDELIALGMTGHGPDGHVHYGWYGTKRRLQSLLDVSAPSSSVSDVKHSNAMEHMLRDLEVLMLLDAGKTVGWDGEVENGAVAFFERAIKGDQHSTHRRDPKVVLNWMIHELLGQLTYRQLTFAQNPLSAEQLGDIVDAVEASQITNTAGKTLLRHILDAATPLASDSSTDSTHTPPSLSIQSLIDQLGLAKSRSDTDLEEWCQRAIDELPDKAERVREGKLNVINALVGRVMKISKGAADAVSARAVLATKLGIQLQDGKSE